MSGGVNITTWHGRVRALSTKLPGNTSVTSWRCATLSHLMNSERECAQTLQCMYAMTWDFPLLLLQLVSDGRVGGNTSPSLNTQTEAEGAAEHETHREGQVNPWESDGLGWAIKWQLVKINREPEDSEKHLQRHHLEKMSQHLWKFLKRNEADQYWCFHWIQTVR